MTDFKNNYLEGIAVTSVCFKLNNKNPFYYLCGNNHVFPWEIEEYAKTGITKFKLTGRDSVCDINSNTSNSAIELYYRYLKGVDDIKTLNDFPLISFLNNSKTNELNNLFGKDIISYMPDINYLRKYGHLCALRCGVECRYCHKCAEKIQKVFEKKVKEMKKQPYYVPACKMVPT